jgi:hypothetical protein
MRTLFLSVALLCLFGDLLAEPSEETRTWLTARYLLGTWYEIHQVQSEIPGLYRLDTTLYEIQELSSVQFDQLRNLIFDSGENKPVREPLTFDIIYSKGGTKLGYIYSPAKNKYDGETERALLTYSIVQDYTRSMAFNVVSFQMPNTDSLCVKLGIREFGLKKAR